MQSLKFFSLSSPSESSNDRSDIQPAFLNVVFSPNCPFLRTSNRKFLRLGSKRKSGLLSTSSSRMTKPCGRQRPSSPCMEASGKLKSRANSFKAHWSFSANQARMRKTRLPCLYPGWLLQALRPNVALIYHSEKSRITRIDRTNLFWIIALWCSADRNFIID